MALEYVQLWTVADAVEWIIDTAGATGVAEERRKARRVVLDCYRELPLRDEWSYYTRPFNFTTDASQSTGTIAFDLTGGTYEREVTLSDATWPENAKFGELILGDGHYPIESRKSDTVVTLREGNAPVADLAAGTSYTYYRSKYPVPIDYRSGSEVVVFWNYGRTLTYVTPAELQIHKASWPGQSSWQALYTVRPAGEFYSGMAFELSPPPSTALTYSGMYQADPRPIGTFGTGVEYSTGTASVSGTAVTGSGTSWSTRMIGCLLRLTTSTTVVPTGLGGAHQADNPYDEQRVVEDVATATGLTMDVAVTGTYSGVKYTIGDPLDLDYHCMLEAFKAMCAWKFAIAIKSDRLVVEEKERNWQREFGRARGADDRSPDNPVDHRFPWHPLYT